MGAIAQAAGLSIEKLSLFDGIVLVDLAVDPCCMQSSGLVFNAFNLDAKPGCSFEEDDEAGACYAIHCDMDANEASFCIRRKGCDDEKGLECAMDDDDRYRICGLLLERMGQCYQAITWITANAYSESD